MRMGNDPAVACSASGIPLRKLQRPAAEKIPFLLSYNSTPGGWQLGVILLC
jgi:hypothetical protein